MAGPIGKTMEQSKTGHVFSGRDHKLSIKKNSDRQKTLSYETAEPLDWYSQILQFKTIENSSPRKKLRRK